MSECKHSSMKYRPDIDGLRAVAVLLVLAYHVGIYRLRGGFVGVDVFFVISGFLIGSIILGDLASDRFSLAGFYERRIRRIFPALVVLFSVVSIFAYKFFLPVEFIEYGKSLLAATFSVSNILFLHQSSYFDTPASMKPLLHTWSLAVEEQFYLLLPLFLMAIRKLSPRSQRLLVVGAALASFAISAIGAFQFEEAAFYLAHTRAWELLLGTLIAMEFFPHITSSISRNICSFSGLLLILVAGLSFTTATPFPGAAALLPCVGAALIIAAGRSGPSLVGQMLSTKPAVFVGMISYSLYLWHWPLIVFQRANAVLVKGLSPNATKLALMGASIALATLSWRFVEVPFRGRRFQFRRAIIFQIAGATAGFLIVCSSGIVLTKGLPGRYPAEAVKVASFLDNTDAVTDAQYRVGTCFITSKNSYEDYDSKVCLKQDSSKHNNLLIGDSHAAQLWFGLSSVFKDVNLMQATASGCKPTLVQGVNAEPKCTRLMNYIFSDYLASHHVDTLLIAARWDDADISRLKSTLDWAGHQGIQVILFGPIVQYDAALPRLLALSIQQHDATIPASHRIAYYQTLDENISAMASSDRHARYISYFKMLCHNGPCQEYADVGVPLQSDYGHLTSGGSLLVATKLRASGILDHREK
jgi:peptidoglycan/LPS O-acetylase OafA/YrhL